jgi:hypothetical protein
MSIATEAKIAELEKRVAELEERLLFAEPRLLLVSDLEKRMQAMESSKQQGKRNG